MDIVIDLTNKRRDKKNISLLWNVEVEDRKNGFINKLPFVKRHQKVERTVYLHIPQININKNLICDKANLISIVIDGIEYEQSALPLSVSLSKLKTPFQLYLNQNSIYDCSEQQQKTPKTYDINFDVVLKETSNNIVTPDEIICSIPQTINVKFVDLKTSPTIKFSQLLNSIQYDASLKKVKIGEITSSIESVYSYTPSQNIEATLKLFNITDDVDWTDKLSIGLVTNNSISYELSNKNAITHPIYLDFSGISNPISDKIELKLSRTAFFSMTDNLDVKFPVRTEEKSIEILKDLCGTELLVTLFNEETREETIVEKTDPKIYIKDCGSFYPCSILTTKVVIDINNIATTPNRDNTAGLVILNLKKLKDEIQNGVEVIDQNDIPVTEFVSIEGDDYLSLISPDGLNILNSKNAKTRIRLTFDCQNIADVKNCKDYHFCVNTTIAFDYYENRDGLELTKVEKKTFKLTIQWKLYLLPNKKWLCVDYGSSAIVCKYGDELLKLNNRRLEVLDEEDITETNEHFLTSDVALNSAAEHQIEETVSSLCTEQPSMESKPYLWLSVCLSPTMSMRRYAPDYLLPCMKILVGNEFLPEKNAYLEFPYQRIAPNGQVSSVITRDSKHELTSLFRVESVFKESYAALLKYFISPLIGNISQVNKLVLTYPNTYTPVHRKILKKIALATFPRLRDNYLQFISESDAVAAYYIDNWSKFNPSGSISDNETVLIYDMGAGTLDITILKKGVVNGKLCVDIMGKLGTGKAGNYLDFIISQIVSEELNIDRHIVSTSVQNDEEEFTTRLNLKYLVKTKIKKSIPNVIYNEDFEIDDSIGENSTMLDVAPLEFDPAILSDDELLRLYISDENDDVDNLVDTGVSIHPSKIVRHELFKSFIKEVTEDILLQLEEYLGEPLSIDTIIMSGRSCRLKPLITSLIRSINELSSGRNHFISFNENSDISKTAVVDGAMVHMQKFNTENSPVQIVSRRLYASYGIVYKTLGGKYKYVELLNHKEIPLTSSKCEFEGKTVVLTGTATASTLTLIQTYLSPGKTEDCYNQDIMSLEYISEMEEYDMDEFGNSDVLNARLFLDQDDNISVYIQGRYSHGKPPKGVDLTSEITKRSIWPVTI